MSSYSGTMPPYPPPAAFGPRGARPGILTAVGVTSIIVAGVCLLAGLIGSIWAFGTYRTAQVVATQNSSANAKSNAAAPVAVLPTPEALEDESAALRAARNNRRTSLIELLQVIRPMSPSVRQQIDGMLARYAERIIPQPLLTAPEVSTQDLREVIEKMGSLPPSQPGDSEGTFFQLRGTGLLEAYSNRAVFKPTDGSGALRSTGPATTAEEDAAVAVQQAGIARADSRQTSRPQPLPPPAPPGNGGNPGQIHPSGLTEAQVQQIAAKAHAASQNKLNAAQMSAVQQALRSQTPPLVQSQMAYSPVRIALVNPDGSATIGFSDGTLVVDASGQIAQTLTNSLHSVTLDPIGLTLMIGEAIASLLLAALLLVSGILLLRSSSIAARLHWVYALLKLPLAVLGGVAFAWVMQDLMSGIGRLSGGGDGGSAGAAGIAMAIGIAGVIYPIVLIIVFSTGTVREFYATERGRA